MARPPAEISDSRKTMYYGGMAIAGIGLLVFLSNFFLIGNFGHGMSGIAARSVIGMLMIFGGAALQRAGAQGLAGSGVILDPQQARRDVEPWSRMTGGIVNDALGEIDALSSDPGGPGRSSAVVKVRCRKCQALNDESSKFCGQCGALM